MIKIIHEVFENYFAIAKLKSPIKIALSYKSTNLMFWIDDQENISHLAVYKTQTEPFSIFHGKI